MGLAGEEEIFGILCVDDMESNFLWPTYNLSIQEAAANRTAFCMAWSKASCSAFTFDSSSFFILLLFIIFFFNIYFIIIIAIYDSMMMNINKYGGGWLFSAVFCAVILLEKKEDVCVI